MGHPGRQRSDTRRADSDSNGLSEGGAAPSPTEAADSDHQAKQVRFRYCQVAFHNRTPPSLIGALEYSSIELGPCVFHHSITPSLQQSFSLLSHFHHQVPIRINS